MSRPGEALLGAIADALPTLDALLAHREPLGAEAADAIEGAARAMRHRLERRALSVVVVGEKKAGKSTFLNAILGARVLGTAMRECTGAVTTLTRADAPDYTARFADGRTQAFADLAPSEPEGLASAIAEARRLEDALAAEAPESRFPDTPPDGTLGFPAERAAWEAALAGDRASRLAFAALWRARLEGQRGAFASYRHHLFTEALRDLTDMEGRGAHVVELAVSYPARHLPEGVVLVDTPGANTDHAENQARAWKAVNELADGCVLLSDLQQVMSRSTRDFLHDMRRVVPHVVLVLTKADRALDNAEDADEGPEAQLAEACRLGVRRFASEMGRDADSVLALAVAAEPALRAASPEAPEARRFEAEAGRLFALLREEKALALGARAASALAQCTRRITEAQSAAEARYAERVRSLEAQRLPDPAAWAAAHRASAKPRAMAHAADAVVAGARAFELGAARLETRWTLAIAAQTSQDELKAALPRWAAEHGQALDALAVEAVEGVEAALGRALLELLMRAHDELRDRYRLAQRGDVVAAPLPLSLPLPGAVDLGAGLGASIAGAVASFESDQATMKAGGAAAGAVLGSMIAPGVGTVVGAALGSMAGRLFGLDMLKEDCAEQVKAGLAAAVAEFGSRMRASGAAYEAALLRRFDAALADALALFDAAIGALVATERARSAAARRDLEGLVALNERLRAHERAIAERMEHAIAHSRGLAAASG